MAKRKELIQTHFSTLEVSPIEGRGGIGTHRTDDLDPQKAYRVLATYMHRYDDGSTVPAFLIEGKDGQVIGRVCTQFKVISSQVPQQTAKTTASKGGVVMGFNDLAREIKRFYDVQDYADGALEELITKALGLNEGLNRLRATIHLERIDGKWCQGGNK